VQSGKPRRLFFPWKLKFRGLLVSRFVVDLVFGIVKSGFLAVAQPWRPTLVFSVVYFSVVSVTAFSGLL
jgi:hypothetical protein